MPQYSRSRFLAAVVSLATLISIQNLPALADGQTAWQALVAEHPDLADDTTLGPLERAVLEVLTPEQHAAFADGADPASLVLASGETLADFLGRSATKGAVAQGLVYYPLPRCRVFQTWSSTDGKMTSGETRNFIVRGEATNLSDQGGSAAGCGVPMAAEALMVNFRVSDHDGGTGQLRVYASDRTAGYPLIHYQADTELITTNASALDLCLAAACTSDFRVWTRNAGAHVRMDVLGYFAPLGIGGLTTTGATTTGDLTVTGLDCTGNAGGGALTADANGVISCSDDDVGDPSPHMVWVDPVNGTPAGPVIFDTINGAIAAADSMIPGVSDVTVFIKPGTYTAASEGGAITLVDNVHLRATTEALTYQVIITTNLIYAGTGRTSITGLHVPHSFGAVFGLLQHNGTGTLDIHNCSIQNAGGAAGSAIGLAGGGVLNITDSVIRADGGTGGGAAVFINTQGGTLSSFGSNLIATPDPEPSVRIATLPSGSTAGIFGPATIEGPIQITGLATATLTLSQVNVRGAGATLTSVPAVSVNAGSTATLALVGLNAAAGAGVAVDNVFGSIVAYTTLGYAPGGAMGFTTPVGAAGGPLALISDGADNLKYDDTRVAPSLAATNVQAALDSLKSNGRMTLSSAAVAIGAGLTTTVTSPACPAGTAPFSGGCRFGTSPVDVGFHHLVESGLSAGGTAWECSWQRDGGIGGATGIATVICARP